METVRRIDTDVLVVGGGLAGLWAALKARESGLRVCLVDKAQVGTSGCSYWGGGRQFAPVPEGELEAWRKEIVEAGEYLSNQQWVDILLQEQGARFHELLSWGVPFARDAQGNVMLRKGRGHKQISQVLEDYKAMMKIMKGKVAAAGVRLLDRVMVTDLLTSDGQHPTGGSVVGAVGFHTRTGEFLAFPAGAVVIAAGPLHTMKAKAYMADNCTGDAAMMAFRAGAEVEGLEFSLNAFLRMYDGKYFYASVGNPQQMAGLHLVNAKGERFMERYDPVLMERALFTVLCKAVAVEYLEGRGPVFADVSHFSSQDVSLLQTMAFHSSRNVYQETGLDPFKDRIPCVVSARISSGSCESGISFRPTAASSLPGLFAAGAACTNPANGISMGGINITFCNVSGYRAGESAARYAREVGEPKIKANQVKLLREFTFSPLGREKGPNPTQVFSKLRDDILTPAGVSLFPNEKRLKRALEEVEEVRQEELANIRARDHHELVKANEARNAALMAKLALLAAMERKESRAWHYMEDFPYRDDENWLKWLVVQEKEREKPQVRAVPIPIESYPVQPPERKRIPAPVQYVLKE